MTKIQYEKPEMNVTEIAASMLFATSAFSINTYSQGEFEEDFAKDRRRTWGDLWEEKK